MSSSSCTRFGGASKAPAVALVERESDLPRGEVSLEGFHNNIASPPSCARKFRLCSNLPESCRKLTVGLGHSITRQTLRRDSAEGSYSCPSSSPPLHARPAFEALFSTAGEETTSRVQAARGGFWRKSASADAISGVFCRSIFLTVIILRRCSSSDRGRISSAQRARVVVCSENSPW